MKELKEWFAGACMTVLMLSASRAADLELLPHGAVRIGLGATGSQRIAVDVSSNLVAWKPLTNVAAEAGQVTFANDPSQSDPSRFFRIADGDDVFAIAGYVDGGAYFGGVADVTVTENLTSTTAITDADGFFHFNQRFARTNLPIKINASADGLGSASRFISATDSGTLSILHMPYVGLSSTDGPILDPILHTTVNRTINFKVTGGPRAGLEFSARFYDGVVSIGGGLSGEGTLLETNAPIPFTYLISRTTPVGATNQIFLFPVESSADGGSGYFSGIPGTNGTLPGNGTITWTNEFHLLAPTNLNGLAFSWDGGGVQFTNNSYHLIWSGGEFNGSFTGELHNNRWAIGLSQDSFGYQGTLNLAFATPTNGLYAIAWGDGQFVSGAMQQTAALRVQPPATISTMHVTTSIAGIGNGAQYTVAFVGGTTGVFSEQPGPASGTYTYTVDGYQAHLYMVYTQFPGDYDDMTLNFSGTMGSLTPSSFTGTQQVGGTIYQFTGTFTY